MSDWHLDKRAFLSVIMTLAAHAALGVWWASATNERLTQVERRLEGFAAGSEAMREQVQDQGRTIAVLLSRIDDTNRNLDLLRTEVATTNALLRELLTESRQ